MNVMQDAEAQKRAQKAKMLRYKKAMCSTLNLETIQSRIEEMQSVSDEVTYAMSNDDVLVEAFSGDEEEAFEFRMAFSNLSTDLDRMHEDLIDNWVPEWFDAFFGGMGIQKMIGYDTEECDYFGFDDSYQEDAARNECFKRMERITKKEIIENAGLCMKIAMSFVALESRWNDLQAALDILKGANGGLLDAIKDINALYDEWAKADYFDRDKAWRKIEPLLERLPDETWLR